MKSMRAGLNIVKMLNRQINNNTIITNGRVFKSGVWDDIVEALEADYKLDIIDLKGFL